MKFKVKRSTWLRGKGPGASVLLRSSDGKMCCLGQIAVDMGIKPDVIKDALEPSGLQREGGPESLYLDIFDRTNLGLKAMTINDDPDINDEERELMLKDHFDFHGHELEFED